MPTASTLKALLVTCLVLIGIGLERLFSAYLVGGQAHSWSTRVVIGVLCLVGSVVLACLGVAAARIHRER